jgi:hypothetical protein
MKILFKLTLIAFWTCRTQSKELIIKPWVLSDSVKLDSLIDSSLLTCPAHIKSFPGGSPNDRADQIKAVERHVVHNSHLRTIYTKGDINTSSLIPTFERCSLHYFLHYQNSNWLNAFDYMNTKIQSFTSRNLHQAVFIIIDDTNPFYLQTDYAFIMFQNTGGHFLFLNSQTGVLFFRNVWGNVDVWEITTKNKEAFIHILMHRKWNRNESSVKLAVVWGESGNLIWKDVDPSRCGKLRVPPIYKSTLLCKKPTVAAEFLASSLNLTTVYLDNTNDTAQLSAGIFYKLQLKGSSSTEVDSVAAHPMMINGLVFQGSEEQPLIYCTITTSRISESTTFFTVWLSPFDLVVWLILGCLLIASFPFIHLFGMCLVPSLGKTNRRNLFSESVFCIFQIIFRQSVPQPSKLALLFILFMILISSLYENFITSSLIVPLKESSLENITAAMDTGYDLTAESGFGEQLAISEGGPGVMPVSRVLRQYANVFRQLGVYDILTSQEGKRRLHIIPQVGAGRSFAFLGNRNPQPCIDNVAQLFPKGKKRIFIPEYGAEDNEQFLHLVNAYSKRPSRCRNVEKGLGQFYNFWAVDSGIRGFMLPVLRTFDESGLYLPFLPLRKEYMFSLMRIVDKAVKEAMPHEELPDSLVSLTNLLPLIYTCLTLIGLAALILTVEVLRMLDFRFTIWKSLHILHLFIVTLNHFVLIISKCWVDKLSLYCTTFSFRRCENTVSKSIVLNCTCFFVFFQTLKQHVLNSHASIQNLLIFCLSQGFL